MKHTKIIAHIGCSEHAFALADICNPYFVQRGEHALLVPFRCTEADYPAFFRTLFTAANLCGAVIAMPYKTVTAEWLDDVSRRTKAAASCNVVRRGKNGRLEGDVFEGEGLVRALKRQGFSPAGKSALVLGCGGIGAAVAAGLAEAGVSRLRLHDCNAPRAGALLRRLQRYHLGVKVEAGINDAHGMDLVVNATRTGEDRHSLPTQTDRIAPHAWVAEAVIKHETALLRAAAAKGCSVQDGTAMALEQIPLHLEYFGLQADTDGLLQRQIAACRRT